MTTPKWFPWLGWKQATTQECVKYGLHLHYNWSILVLEWFGNGLCIYAKEVGRRGGVQ